MSAYVGVVAGLLAVSSALRIVEPMLCLNCHKFYNDYQQCLYENVPGGSHADITDQMLDKANVTCWPKYIESLKLFLGDRMKQPWRVLNEAQAIFDSSDMQKREFARRAVTRPY